MFSLDVRKQAARIAPAATLILALGFAPRAQGQCEAQCNGDCRDSAIGKAAIAACVAKCVCLQCHTDCQNLAAGTAYPKYILLGFVYAPPGCTSSSTFKCGQESQVQYSTTNSIGTQTSINNSFQAGIDASVGPPQTGSGNNGNPTPGNGNGMPGNNSGATLSGGVQFTKTSNQDVTVTVTNTRNLSLQGLADGVDHNQDHPVLLLNPQFNIQKDYQTVSWTPGIKGQEALIFDQLTVSELKDPSTMPANVATGFTQLGFTNADYQTILAQDPFASGATLEQVDPNQTRFADTGYAFGYAASGSSDCSNGSCSCVINGYVDNTINQDANTLTATTSYNANLVGSIPVLGSLILKLTGSLNFTNSVSNTNTKSGTQSATLNLACPSPSFNSDDIFVGVYWDALYGTFLFVPFDATNSTVIQQGVITTTAGAPASRELVTLSFDGKTYRTYSDLRGHYKFVLASKAAKSVAKEGQLSVKDVRTQVALPTTSPSQIRIQ